MVLHANLERSFAGLNTKAPFEYRCGLDMGPWKLPAGSILSILVECGKDDVPPARLSSVSCDGDMLSVEFGGADGHVICRWDNDTAALLNTPSYQFDGKDYCTALLVGDGEEVKGHVVFEKSLPRLLHDMARRSGNRLRPRTDDFILLPQCHAAWSPLGCRRFTVNGGPVYGDLDISVGANARMESTPNLMIDPVEFGLAGDYTLSEGVKNRITSIKVGSSTYSCSGKHLYIYASPTSNARVTAGYTGITIGSVLDVQ